MPNDSLKLKPGVNVEQTPALLETGYQYASLIRWRDGLPEKIGGWTKYYSSQLTGVPRDLHAWQNVANTKFLAVGTSVGLNIVSSGQLTNISPQQLTNNITPSFTTTNGSTTVTVNDSSISNISKLSVVYFPTPVAVGGTIVHGVYAIASVVDADTYTITVARAATASVSNTGSVPSYGTSSGSNVVTVTFAAHGLSVGNTISLPVSTTVAGLTVNGTYSVKSVPTSDSFTIELSASASSTTSASMNSGNVRIVYYIAIGPDLLTPTTFGMLGFGAIGQFGIGDPGSGAPIVSSTQTGAAIAASDWTLDNLVSFLVACPTGGALYYWIAGQNLNTAVPMSANAPLFNEGAFVSQASRIVVAYGSTANETIGITQDPLLVRWCTIEDFTVWAASATNYAGSFRVPTGSRIVGGTSTAKTDLLWTDLDVYTMTFLGGQGTSGSISLVYAIRRAAEKCGLISKRAFTSFQDAVYWMGQNNFFRISGSGVQTLPCSVWDAVFQDLDTANASKCWATSNTPYSEIWFYYPSVSGGTGECDKYVKYNVITQIWDYGPVSGTTAMPRSCGIDQSVLGMPILASPSGYLYQHETGRDADGSPITWAWESGWFTLSEARDFPFCDEIYPDFKFGTFSGSPNASISLTFYGRDNLNTADADEVYGPYTMTATSGKVEPRIRNRYLRVKVSGSDSATFSRLGNMRFRVAPDGRN